MNRRKFLKFTGGLLAATPFMPLVSFQRGGVVSSLPVAVNANEMLPDEIIINVDKAKEKGDYSVSFMAITADGKDRFIPLHGIETNE